MRAHPAGGIAEDASARAMTAGLAFPIVYPLLAALQACTDINASTTLTLRQWEPTTYQLSAPAPHPKLLPAPKSFTSAHEVTNRL